MPAMARARQPEVSRMFVRSDLPALAAWIAAELAIAAKKSQSR